MCTTPRCTYVLVILAVWTYKFTDLYPMIICKVQSNKLAQTDLKENLEQI